MRRHLGFTMVLALILAGCGGGSGTGASTTVGDTGPGAPSNVAMPNPAACTADVAINAGFSRLFRELPDGPPSGPATPEIKAQIKAGYDEYLAKPLADFKANVPPPIAATTNDALSEVRRFAQTGDASILESEDLIPKVMTINRYLFDYCPGEKSLVTATDYDFGGLSPQLKAGVNRFSLTNTGTEKHNLGILVKKPGVTQSFDAILALPQEQAMSKADVIAFVESPTRQSDYTSVDLPAGSYAVVCFVPKGSVGDTEGDGPPHFTLGMKKELTVA